MPTIPTKLELEHSLSLLKVYAEEPRVAVMFSILLISLFAVSFPGVSKHIPFLRIPHLVFFIGKHFGTGVILSTAFCHLLPDAFESLQDPEVNRLYHGIGKWTGLIILSALLSIFLIEYISTSYVDHLHRKPSAPTTPSSSRSPSPKTPPQRPQAIRIPAGSSSEPQVATPCASPNCTTRLPTDRTPLLQNDASATKHTRRPKRSQSLHNLNDDGLLESLIYLNAPRLSRGSMPRGALNHPGWGHEVACVCHMRLVQAQAHENTSVFDDDDEDEGKEDILETVGRKRQVVGILLFEGLSLGIRIAGLPPSPKPNRPWLAPTLSILFAITTPLGMGTGVLAFTSAHKGEAARMRLTQGLMSGISAGMLIYAATVEMLGGDFVFGDVGGDYGHGHGHGHEPASSLQEPSHEESAVKVRRKVLAVCSLLAGATAMALVGLEE
ncbi:hypothetical protein DXG01_012086 [Tephrocybe rancida]|nr:hypothetical protein DXG01_012086 [Tephrocybe rancida]